ncbi:MAG: UDP-N-acetylmuramoyl-L-alanyl-D-glutamate--2,6-diaminopimelate ligase [Candidatus Omnitrophica bacterium]|nr:UDP-N-acetylmuramoyl-L-alanyl-D-glutamate--2,6-diaminopimelate ligase [Candidatus Omnitrophota bacterium]
MKNLKIIGITGTNGKTTTAFLIYHLLKKMGQKTSLVGTIKYLIGSKTYKAKLTTPGFIDLGKIIKKIKEAGSDFVVIEVSSHGLIQGRVKGLKFCRCLFTNLSRDHLDYHKTMKNYFNAKKKLFSSPKNVISFINIDDCHGRKIAKELKKASSFAIKSQADFRAENIVLEKNQSSFEIVSSHKRYKVKTHLCGRYNVLNILGAVGLVFSLGFPLSKLARAVSSFRSPPGRLEPVAKDLFIDYAHTPDALSNVLENLRESGYKKIICLFGCGGDRDKGKRRLMGQIASARADFTFITSDNPRSEDSLKICSQIEKGFKNKKYSVIVDRYKAIDEAIKFFLKNKSNDSCFLIAGKGHEDYQIIKDKRIPFSDKKAVKQLLKR